MGLPMGFMLASYEMVPAVMLNDMGDEWALGQKGVLSGSHLDQLHKWIQVFTWGTSNSILQPICILDGPRIQMLAAQIQLYNPKAGWHVCFWLNFFY